MHSELKKRYESLRSEYESGQKMLADLDTRRSQLTNILLRIEGAMQVLQELLGTVEPSSAQEHDLAAAPTEGTARKTGTAS